MSDMDQQPDPVQPEGQGGEGTGGSPYGEYLNRIPDEARPVAEEAFKAWDANYTRHQQEASEYRKQWEPFEQLGVNQLSPDDVQWALQFRQAAMENPSAVRDWYEKQYAPANGLTDQQEPQTPPADELGFPDPSAQQLEQMLQQHLGPVQQQLQQITQWREQQEAQVREEVASRAIETRMHELEKEHPGGFDRQWVERLASKYAEPGADPRRVVDQGFADYQALVGQVEKRTLQEKVDAPSAPESGGAVNAGTEQPSFGSSELRDQAAAVLRASFRQ